MVFFLNKNLFLKIIFYSNFEFNAALAGRVRIFIYLFIYLFSKRYLWGEGSCGVWSNGMPAKEVNIN
jgi:hypothetical protein